MPGDDAPDQVRAAKVDGFTEEVHAVNVHQQVIQEPPMLKATFTAVVSERIRRKQLRRRPCQAREGCTQTPERACHEGQAAPIQSS